MDTVHITSLYKQVSIHPPDTFMAANLAARKASPTSCRLLTPHAGLAIKDPELVEAELLLQATAKSNTCENP
jgi:hypothetical protein